MQASLGPKYVPVYPNGYQSIGPAQIISAQTKSVPVTSIVYNPVPTAAPLQSAVLSNQAYAPVQTVSVPVNSVIFNPAPTSAPEQTTSALTYVQEPVFVQYVRPSTYVSRSGSSNVVDDVNRFILQSSARPHIAELEKFGGRRSSKAPSRSDLECAFGKALRGNIFEPKFIF